MKKLRITFSNLLFKIYQRQFSRALQYVARGEVRRVELQYLSSGDLAVTIYFSQNVSYARKRQIYSMAERALKLELSRK